MMVRLPLMVKSARVVAWPGPSLARRSPPRWASLVCLGSAGDVRSFPDQALPAVDSRGHEHPCSKHGFVEHLQTFGAEAVEPVGAEVRSCGARKAGGVQGLDVGDLGCWELTRRTKQLNATVRLPPDLVGVEDGDRRARPSVDVARMLRAGVG